MSKWEENVRKVTPYTPGEQPNRPGMIKLNTNENPYPPGAGRLKSNDGTGWGCPQALSRTRLHLCW